MLKYKNRLTPNIYTLQKLVTFYKKKKTTSLFSLNSLTAFWFIQNLKKENPSFTSIFSNLHLLTQPKWFNVNFKTPSNSLVSQKYFLNTYKLPLFKKQKKFTIAPSPVNYFQSYTGLYAMSRPLIGKPFNSQNTYFFVSKNYEQEKSFKLKPFFSRIIWKTHFLNVLRERFTFNTTKISHNQTRSRLLTSDSFGGPIPSTSNLFQKPYLFTNTSEKKPVLKNFTLSLLKNPFIFFKNTKKNFVRRRFSWSKSSFVGYKFQTSQYFLLASFNLLSSIQSQELNKKHFQKLINQKTLLVNHSAPKIHSLNFFSETVKLLRVTKVLGKSTNLLGKSVIGGLINSQNNLLSLNLASPTRNLLIDSFKYWPTTSYKYRLQKLVLKKRNKLFRRKKTLRVKFLRKLVKLPLTPLTHLPLSTYLVRPRRWGRKFLRRGTLKRGVNLSTFSLTLLKGALFVKNQSRFISKVNHGIIKKKFLWRKFLKWKKVKKLKTLSIKQRLIFTNFFTKFLKNNFSTPFFSNKLKFRLTILRNLTRSGKTSPTTLPKLFSNNSILKDLNSRYLGLQLVSHLNTPVSLTSNYKLNFIFPLYGFLFITSNNLTKNQLTTNQILQKKTSHSFFYLSDLKSFIAGKHSTVSNNYNSFFTPTDDLHTNQPSSFNVVGGASMSNFLTKNFNSMVGEALNSNFSQRHENDPRIPRFKFKPGYSRIWRRARVGVKEYFQIKFQYQHRLTRFLPQFYKLNQITLIKSTELKLENLLLFSYLLPDLITCQEFLNSGLVFLNGRIVSSGKVYVVRNDLIQLLISMKYYVLFKWFTNWEVSKKIRLNRLLYLSRLKTKRTFRKTLPDWVLRKISFPYDVPKYVEVDYLTLSAFVLYEPYLLNDFTHMFQKFSRSPIYNVYNWKYLT